MHTVLMKTRPGVTEARLAELMESLRELAIAVAGPDSLVIGPNVTEEPLDQGYDFGFIIRFTDREALSA